MNKNRNLSLSDHADSSSAVGDVGQLLAGVQSSLFDSVDEIRLWVCRLREGGGPLLVEEALGEIDESLSVCDGQLSILDGVSL